MSDPSEIILSRMDDLEKQIRTLQVTVDRQQGDIDYDHKNIADWAIEMAGVKEAIKQLSSVITKQGTRISDKIIEGVQDAITEAPKEIANQVLDEASKNSKKGKTLKRSLWARIWGRYV